MFVVAHSGLWLALFVVPVVVARIHGEPLETSDRLTGAMFFLSLVPPMADYPALWLLHRCAPQVLNEYLGVLLIFLLGTIQWFLVGFTLRKLFTIVTKAKEQRRRSGKAPGT